MLKDYEIERMNRDRKEIANKNDISISHVVWLGGRHYVILDIKRGKE